MKENIKIKLALVGLIVLMLFTSCSTVGKGNRFNQRSIVGNKYVNPYFGLEIELHSGWFTMPNGLSENLINHFGELMFGEDKKKVIKSIKNKSGNLLVTSKNETAYPDLFNPNLILNAVNIKSIPEIKTGKDFIFLVSSHMKQLIINSQIVTVSEIQFFFFSGCYIINQVI